MADKQMQPIWDPIALAAQLQNIARQSQLLMQLCVPKIKPARSDGEVRPRLRTKLWDRIAEPAENSAYLCLETDVF
jgi:hypothetical protein